MMIKRFAVLLSALAFCLFCLPALADTITLPSGLTEIAAESFLNTQSADVVIVPEGVTTIGARAFAASGLKGIIVPDTVTAIAEDAFDDTSLDYAVCSADSYAAEYFAALEVPCQEPFPSKSFITAICPWAAGGDTDAILRAFCMTMGRYLNTTIVVDNVTGSGGIKGHQAIADAETSGHTLGMVTFELSTYAPLGTSELTHADYDPLCLINTDAAAVIVNTDWANSKKIKDLDDFIAYCKKYPSTVKLGGASNGSVWHIAGGYLMEQTGIDVQMITYANGAADAVKAAAMGEIQGVTVSAKEARAFIEPGILTCLGVMSDARDPALPDAPTCAEAGYDLEFGTFRGIAMPKGISEDVRSLLIEASSAAINDPEFVSFMENGGQQITYLDDSDFTAYLRQHAQDVVSAMEAVDLL